MKDASDRRRVLYAALWVGLGAALTPRPLVADTVTVRGTTIPFRECTVTEVGSGRVYYRDARGRRQWREVGEVEAIGFEGLPRLDEAEAALVAGRSDDGVRLLLLAALEAEGEVEPLWVRVRLARVHAGRGEFVQASGHAAAVMMMQEDVAWRELAPGEPVDRPSFPAAVEALDQLTQAQKKVVHPELRAVVAHLIEAVEPVHAALAEQWSGPAPDPRDTISGVPIAEIREGAGGVRAGEAPGISGAGAGVAAPGATTPEAGAAGQAPATSAPLGEPQTPARGERADGPRGSTASDDAIDRMLDEGRVEDAIALCERIARAPGHRSIGTFLHQYGRTLAAAGRPREAVVMFTRGAFLFDSPDTAASLVEAAIIHRDVFADHEAARRLATHAIAIATAPGQGPVVERGRRVIESLDAIAPAPAPPAPPAPAAPPAPPGHAAHAAPVPPSASQTREKGS